MTADTISPESLNTEYLRPAECVFYKSDAGFIGAKIKDKKYDRVLLKRALPFGAPEDYICVSDIERNELGILEHVSEFDADQQALIHKELSLRYFTPVISDIISIKEKMGHFYFDVKIGSVKKSFTVKDLSKNVRTHDENIDIIDIDGNRYRIEEFKRRSKDEKFSRLTMLALAEQCGFKKTTFFAAFKKFEGCTPGEWAAKAVEPK